MNSIEFITFWKSKFDFFYEKEPQESGGHGWWKTWSRFRNSNADRVLGECTFSMKTLTLLIVDHAMTSRFALWLLLFPKALPHRFHLAKSFGDRQSQPAIDKVDRPSTKSTNDQQSQTTINKLNQQSKNSNGQKTLQLWQKNEKVNQSKKSKLFYHLGTHSVT